MLVTPLAVEVQEDAPQGRVRVTVKNVVDDEYISEVHVKVIGTRNSEFISGETDLRGVFVADGIQGRSTVIAQVDQSRYAFFRGETELGPPPTAPNAPAPPADATPTDGKSMGKMSNERVLLEQLEGGNRDIQQKQQIWLDNNYKMNNSGVKAQSAF